MCAFQVVISKEIDQIFLIGLPQSQAIEEPLISKSGKSINVATLRECEKVTFEIGARYRPPRTQTGFIPKGFICFSGDYVPG